MKQKILLGLLIILLLIGGYDIYQIFMQNHTYYIGMLSNFSHWKLIFGGLLSSFIPVAYLIWNKKFSFKKLLISLFIGLALFSIIHVSIKDTILGATGLIMLLINIFIIFGLSIYFLTGTLAFGSWLSDKIIKFKEQKRQEILINFGIGLSVFMFIIYYLMLANLIYGVIMGIIFVGLGIIMYVQRQRLKQYGRIIQSLLEDFHITKKQHWRQWIGIFLLIISVLYYIYGFQLSFIPYPTAWDANHAYMYFPKARAANHGVFWGGGPGGTAPHLRYGFLTFWFSFIGSMKNIFWLSADTIAVAMNFLSGFLVLVFGLGLIKEIINYCQKTFKKIKISPVFEHLSFYIGRTGLLLRLTSGMGAFLIFVDNKTDLGVLSITLLAVLSGVIFIKYIADHKKQTKKLDKESLKYVIISGFLFAAAIMSKQTAFIDVAVFTLFLGSIWFNSIIGLGGGFILFGFLAKLQILNTPDMISDPAIGRIFIGIGIVITLIGIGKVLYTIYQKQTKRLSVSKNIRYVVIWLLALIAVLLIGKGPGIVPQYIQGNIGGEEVIKNIFLADKKTPKKLPSILLSQATTSIITPTTCSLDKLDTTTEDLYKNLKETPQGNEDIGRYVGYGRKTLSPQGSLHIGYHLLKTVFPQGCYSKNSTAKKLCENEIALNNFNLTFLQDLYQTTDKDTQAYEILSGVIMSAQNANVQPGDSYNPQQFRDEIVALRQYMQNNVIKSEEGQLHIPYRYIVPINAIYNRSLQNHSSYYTDIGFIRMLFLLILLISFFYAFICLDKKLLSLTGSTIIGRIVWWIIAGGIVWYGIGLIVWTILVLVIFFQRLLYKTSKKNISYVYISLAILAVRILVQFVLNFVRISSQGANGPFIRYKTSAGKIQTINENLQQTQDIKVGYNWKDVFDLQFPHYNPFITHVKDREDEDGVSIDGTYIQYFLENQNNVGNADIRRLTSDGNTCKSRLRFQDQNRKYLVIDPNMLSVVMGEGNESLFNRFFAKRDPVSGRIEQDGELTMLVKMRYDGYIDLISTNNLGAKYAFELSDTQLQQTFGENLTHDDLVFLRAKLIVARYFPDAQQLVEFIGNVFSQRVMNGQAIGDIAAIYGKIVTEQDLLNIANQYISGRINPQQLQQQIITLTQDERLILAQYLGLYNMLRSNNGQYQQQVSNLLQQSLSSSSQIVAFELID